MIKRENRLKKNKHFNYIYKHGNSVRANCIVIIYSKTKFKNFKVGFSVSNKIGKSVVRNKVKRRMREAFNQIAPLVNTKFNYIFVARDGIAEKSFLEIKDHMFNAVKKAELLNDSDQNNSISF